MQNILKMYSCKNNNFFSFVIFGNNNLHWCPFLTILLIQFTFLRSFLTNREQFLSINKFHDLADILYRAAEEGNHVDPQKVEQILGVSRTSTARGSVPEETITGGVFTFANKQLINF